MKINTKAFCDCLIWLLTLFWVVAIYLFTMETWGRYIYLALAVAIFLLTALRNGGRIRVKLCRYHTYVLAFVVYTGFSAVWDGVRLARSPAGIGPAGHHARRGNACLGGRRRCECRR